MSKQNGYWTYTKYSGTGILQLSDYVHPSFHDTALMNDIVAIDSAIDKYSSLKDFLLTLSPSLQVHEIVGIRGEYCALCQIYAPPISSDRRRNILLCAGCPINLYTGFAQCKRTPWASFSGAYDVASVLEVTKREIDFLLEVRRWYVEKHSQEIRQDILDA